jgi:hypothetical protein
MVPTRVNVVVDRLEDSGRSEEEGGLLSTGNKAAKRGLWGSLEWYISIDSLYIFNYTDKSDPGALRRGPSINESE